jgi:hypothetical protein
VFNGRKLDEWLVNWLATFQQEVNRLLRMFDLQFTMEIWCPGKTSQPLPISEVLVEGIGIFHQVSIKGNTSFPYLDIQLSWSDKGKLCFGVYKKPAELVKYLNHNSHHHHNHRAAVLSGVKLHLELPTQTKASRIYMLLLICKWTSFANESRLICK